MKAILNFKQFSYLLFSLLTLAACKQDELNKPVVTNKNPPAQISNVKVFNKSGKAIITYTLPSDKDLLYVKANYEIGAGRNNEVKVSIYTNTLTVDGFGDTLEHDIKLYAVNSSEVASAPVDVTVKPTTPAHILAFRSLQVNATFGGFVVKATNPGRENLIIIPMVDTAGNGQWVQTAGLDNIYSNDSIIVKTLRGQLPVSRKYGFTVRDRWLNYSDTLIITLTPLNEILIPKSTWSNYVLPGDVTLLYSYTTPANIYDGNFNPGWPLVLFTVESASSPQSVTLDLSKAYTFSRLKMNPFLELGNIYYGRGNLKDFEIWGSNNPSLSGDFDNSWTKLVTCNVIKPSGSPLGTETPADYNSGFAGWDFDFPPGTGAYRYVRIRNLSNWSGTYFMSIGEFTLWGQ